MITEGLEVIASMMGERISGVMLVSGEVISSSVDNLLIGVLMRALYGFLGSCCVRLSCILLMYLSSKCTDKIGKLEIIFLGRDAAIQSYAAL